MKSAARPFFSPVLLPLCLFFLTAAPTAQLVASGGTGVSGGTILIEGETARASALGGAFASVGNDVGALNSNPASAASLTSAQATFFYEKGLFDTSLGQFFIGAPTRDGGVGLQAAYRDAGRIDLADGPTDTTVRARTDLAFALSYAHTYGDLSFGVAGKYLASEMLERARATAVAGDAGLTYSLGARWRLVAAAQNFGSNLRFVDEGDPLPRLFRFGAARTFHLSFAPSLLILEAPYFVNEKQWQPAAGLEVSFGPLALRGGYAHIAGAQKFSAGTGLTVGAGRLDYAFSIVEGFSAEHRISLSMAFGDRHASNAEAHAQPEAPASVAPPATALSVKEN